MGKTWQLFQASITAAKACQFRTREMAKMLKQQAGGAENFRNITAGTITHWIDNSGYAPKWNQWALERAEKEGKRVESVARLGRPRMLVSDYQICEYYCSHLLGELPCRCCEENQE